VLSAARKGLLFLLRTWTIFARIAAWITGCTIGTTFKGFAKDTTESRLERTNMPRSTRTKLEKPADLDPAGSDFWDHVTKSMRKTLKPTDQAALVMACRWIDRFNIKLDSDDKGADIGLGIATDKFLAISAKFGFTPKDRKDEGGNSKPKAIQNRTGLDDLSPAALGEKSAKSKD
jgi:hypothetical protein